MPARPPKDSHLPKSLKPNKHRIRLWDGRELQYHPPFQKAAPLDLKTFVPEAWKPRPLEVEIGPGKGEFLATRSALRPDRYFIGIDRRQDRVELTKKKLSRIPNTNDNAVIIQHDARSFLAAGLPPLAMLHIYHPDPWPKFKHHKNRFFRSPDAKAWVQALIPGAVLKLSTDHKEYFEEIVDILKSWSDLGVLEYLGVKNSSMGLPMTHFEGIFLKKNEPVYKAIFRRI